MAKFVLLFVGGLVPDEKREQNSKDWMAWMGKLGAGEKLVDGAPFGPHSKVVSGNGEVKDYDWHNDSNVGGYCLIKAEDVDEAVELAKDCPQLAEEYGSGSVEVREFLEMM
jgi:hypothetical protein